MSSGTGKGIIIIKILAQPRPKHWQTRKERHMYYCHQGKEHSVVFNLFQHQIIYPGEHHSQSDLQCVCISWCTDALVNGTKVYNRSSAFISHRRIHSREHCWLFLYCGKIFRELMPFIMQQTLCNQDVLLLAILIVVESLASNKVATPSEAPFPRSIDNLSLSFWHSFPSFFQVD